MDVDQLALASMSEDHKEGVGALLERRKPKFRDAEAPNKNLENNPMQSSGLGLRPRPRISVIRIRYIMEYYIYN